MKRRHTYSVLAIARRHPKLFARLSRLVGSLRYLAARQVGGAA